MNRTKTVSRILSTILSVLLLCAACAKAPATPIAEPSATNTPSDAPAAERVTVTDMAGRTVTVDAPITRIVALTASDCENLYAVGAGELLVGRGEYCNYPPEALDAPSVQSGFETNLEQIIALEPQVVLMSTMAQSEEQIAALEQAGIQVVVSKETDIAGVYAAIDMIGALTGKSAEAKAVTDNMQAAFAKLSAETADADGKTVYFEVSPLQYGLWTAGAGTFMDEIAAMLHLTNCFADVTGWAEISEEQVLERNPDYIVTISMYYGEGPTPTEEILARKGWENVTAVQNAAILNLINDELSRPTQRLVDGAELLYEFVYGVEALDAAA